jgi:hypothetical protein
MFLSIYLLVQFVMLTTCDNNIDGVKLVVNFFVLYLISVLEYIHSQFNLERNFQIADGVW